MMRQIVLLLWAGAVMAAPAHAWFLMGRHGECAPVSNLGRKDPALADVTDPYDLVERMRAAGYRAELNELKSRNGSAVQVNISARGLHLLFVKREACKEMISPKR